MVPNSAADKARVVVDPVPQEKDAKDGVSVSILLVC